MKLFHRKLIRFTSKANLGVVFMAYRYFERYKCSRLISRLHGLTDNGTDNVLGNRLSCDNRVDFSRRKWRPEKAVCIRAFCNKTALNMNFLSNKTHTVLWPFIPLYKAGSAQTYSNIVWLLHLKRCFWFHCFKIKRTADVFYCYPSSRQRKGIKYEENRINLVKFSFLSEVLLLCYSQLNQPFPYIGRVYVPYLRRSCHCTCSCKQRDVAVCSTIILRPWVLNGSRRLNPRSPCYISLSFL